MVLPNKHLILFYSAIVVTFFSSCLKDEYTKTYTIIKPVYEKKAAVLAGIKSSNPQEILNAGKIYLYNNYIFLNEIDKGVHIIDNTNPASPKNIAFINIPGSRDIAVKNNILYADIYTDLLTIDITSPLNAKLLKVNYKLFPERQYAGVWQPDTTLVITNWISKDTTVSINISEEELLTGCRRCAFANASYQNSITTTQNGKGGSMARFAIVNDYLYAVNNSSLHSLSISNNADPVLINTNNLGWNIETIYPFNDKLFIGSATGMFIFDITSQSQPQMKGRFTHARACDPVVADDTHAYVTLRTGTFCSGTSNQLDVLDVSDITTPALLKTYQLNNPHGLAKDGNLLFVCDGAAGLKVYNTSNPVNLKLIQQIDGIDTYDAIAGNNNLVVVTTDKILQYDYSTGKLKPQSTIIIKH
jgi:hypothetical protein